MLLEPDRFRHTPPIAPERSHSPPRPTLTEAKRTSETPLPRERESKQQPDKA